MQNLEGLTGDLLRGGKGEKLRTLAASRDGERLAELIDAGAVERAAASGDGIHKACDKDQGTDDQVFHDSSEEKAGTAAGLFGKCVRVYSALASLVSITPLVL